MKLTIGKHDVQLTNLDKVLWPELGYTKGDLINYYINMYPYLKEYLLNRPLSMKSYPDGINGKSFYQKDCPDYAPHWLSTYGIFSGHRKDIINWVTINKLSDLVWVANRASIELHTWFSTTTNLDKPDFAVFDLDPGSKSSMKDVVDIALTIKNILDEFNVRSFVKTSGKRGLHVYIPVKTRYTYKEIRSFLQNVAEMVIKLKPEQATVEWRKNKRQGKVYIDYRQNGKSKTLPAPYSLRPTSKATVSTPLKWSEITPDLNPDNYNIKNIETRIKQKGNIWETLLKIRQELPGLFLGLLLFLSFSLFGGLNTFL
ncbi:non-homologous end-joining DNA ligase [Halothermothrix orenii]|uniref:DNA polymerase LigD polymerase domain protein n=1 Tax=Halothermothrix orenii (strain H 168 / OCM 544 / DSM 9562) TaxID=373903 RepID=B8D1M5_HALOH|nr:non-homologous end-joining DNA ligase [Halothermothrix orenii]ACL69102.1 DNA polymerase LigD polymerase domain protein [Halothermothrix orenii H 168]